jgi:hypothetical protein
MESPINIYEMFSLMSNHQLMVIYQGLLDQEMIKSLVSMTEKKLIQDNTLESTRKKLFNIMIEGLQNICKHQLKSEDPSKHPFMMMGRSNSAYHVITGNLIRNDKISLVRSKIDHVNSLNKDELKEYYKQARLNSVISEVGGAGLGFIDMARKSENKIEYEFYAVNDEHSLFIQLTKVNNQ